MRRVRPSLPSVLLLAASTLFCAGLLLAGEWIVRAQGPDRLRLSPARSAIVHSSLYGWQLRPNWALRDEEGRQVSTDSERRRVQTRRPAALAGGPGVSGAPRVAVLGDSVAFGAGVDDAETFANLLAARAGWAVANFAVPGWGTDQSLLRYEHDGRAWRPSVVVLNVCLANDLADNMLANYLYDPAWPKPYFTLRDGELQAHADHLVRSRFRRSWEWLWENSHLLNLIAAPSGERREASHWMGRRRVAVKDTDAAARLTVRVMQRLRDEARRDGIALLVALHPDRAAFEQRSVVAARLDESLSGSGVLALDLGGRYRAAGWAFTDLMLDGLGHLSPRGHAVAAELIGEAILGLPVTAGSGPVADDQR
jgi:hypothetical protein